MTSQTPEERPNIEEWEKEFDRDIIQLYRRYNIMKDYKDYAPRVGSKHPVEKLADYFLATLVSLFILALVGSAIWGNEGFVDLLASFF